MFSPDVLITTFRPGALKKLQRGWSIGVVE